MSVRTSLDVSSRLRKYDATCRSRRIENKYKSLGADVSNTLSYPDDDFSNDMGRARASSGCCKATAITACAMSLILTISDIGFFNRRYSPFRRSYQSL